MHALRVWGVAAALAVGAGGSAAAADARPWYKKMFGGAPEPAPAAPVGPTVRSGPVVAAPNRAPTPAMSPDTVASAFKAESDAYLRRMDVCLKLRQAALDRNDDALYRQVDELERQAKAIYEQRIGAMGVSKSAKAPLPSTGTGFAASFDLAPEKPIDPQAAAAKLVAPAAPVPVSGTAELREVKP